MSLTLKWGTLKGWNFENESPRCMELIKRYVELGSSMSVMAQHDTPEQKQIICDLIDEVNGDIYNDWEGVEMSKADAKKYVSEYGKTK